MIVATAGHVDHGKTTLIRVLTGQDTDRLAEEKRRGLTIDLGFAWTRTEQGHWLGFVDVPGHEKFIRNMVAGVTAVDAVLLVVAADDGPMPQTREHLAILDLLGVNSGAVALTRADRVDQARLTGAREETRQLLAGTGLAEAPVYAVSGTTGEGTAALAGWLADRAANNGAQTPAAWAAGARLVVDRSFSVRGSGCVVTGTVIAGTLCREDILMVSPAGGRVRVRGLQIHGEPVERVGAGQRCALNLAGDLTREQIHRGDWLVAPELHQPTDRLDVTLTLLPDVSLHRGTFQVHLGAAVRSCRVVVLDPGTEAEEPALVQLMLDQPVQGCTGDRFILRDPALNHTVGGGRVVDPPGMGRGRSASGRIALLRSLATITDPATQLDAWLVAHPEGVNLDRFGQAINLPRDGLDKLVTGQQRAIVETGAGRIGFARTQWDQLQVGLLDRLDQWHREYPDRIGPTEPELTRLPDLRLDPEVRHALLQALLTTGVIVRNGFRFHRPEHRLRLGEADQVLLELVMEQLEGTSLKPPIVGELAEALGQERDAMLAFLERMHRLGVLVAVAPNRFYRPETVDELTGIAVALAGESPTGAFDARAYRDRSGIGRRLTVSVLEYLDRAGVTAFINDERRLQPGYHQQVAVTRSNHKKGYTANS